MPLDIDKVARLAHIALCDEERSAIEARLIRLGELLDELPADSSDVVLSSEPARLRPDEAAASFPREDILKNAPQQREGCFAVPKVVG